MATNKVYWIRASIIARVWLPWIHLRARAWHCKNYLQEEQLLAKTERWWLFGYSRWLHDCVCNRTADKRSDARVDKKQDHGIDKVILLRSNHAPRMVQKVYAACVWPDHCVVDPWTLSSLKFTSSRQCNGNFWHHGRNSVFWLLSFARVCGFWVYPNRTLVGAVQIPQLRINKLYRRSRFHQSVLLVRYAVSCPNSSALSM